MSLTKSLKSKNYLYLLFFNLFVFNLNFAQCDTPNFTVTKINGTCQSNGSIAVTVPSSLDCSGWIAELVRTSDGNSTQLSIPTNGGTITFTSLTPNNYNVFLTNGITTFSYTQNPVNISTSYVPMTVSTTSTAPSCSVNRQQKVD